MRPGFGCPRKTGACNAPLQGSHPSGRRGATAAATAAPRGNLGSRVSELGRIACARVLAALGKRAHAMRPYRAATHPDVGALLRRLLPRLRVTWVHASPNWGALHAPGF